jgi:TetR/AcrR family transcriptional regulator
MRRRARRTRRRQASDTERLLDAALEVFTTHGFHGSTLDQVAAAARVTTGAVHSRFDGRAEIAAGAILSYQP